MSQFSNDIDSLSVKGAEKLDPATLDRISGYIQSGKLRSEDVDSLSKGVQHVDSAAFDRISKAIDSENVKQQTQAQDENLQRTIQMAGYPNEPERDRAFEVVFPRSSKLDPIVDPTKQKLASIGLDLLSLPGRVSMSGPRTIRQTAQDVYSGKPVLQSVFNMPGKWAENVSLTETPSEEGAITTVSNVVEDFGRHPSMIIPGPGRVGGAISKIAPGLTLAAREFTPAVVKGLGRVGAEGATQIGIGEATRASTGEETGAGDIILEGLVGGTAGLIPGLRSWGREKADKIVGDIITEHKKLMGGELRGFDNIGSIKNAEELKSMVKEAMGGFYSPNLSITQNLEVWKKLTQKNPLFLKDKKYAKGILDVVDEGLTQNKQTLGIGDLIVSKIPVVGPAYIGGKTASHAADILSPIKNNPISSSTARSAGAVLLDNLSRPAQDKVAQTQSKIDTIYNRSKSIGNGLLGR